MPKKKNIKNIDELAKLKSEEQVKSARLKESLTDKNPKTIIPSTVAPDKSGSETTNPAKAEPIKVEKRYTRRVISMTLFGALAFIGLLLFVFYMLGDKSIIIAYIAIPLLFIGGIGFWYSKSNVGEVQTTYVGNVPKKQVNSLVIYSDRAEFADILKPSGFVWTWDQDNKKYYLYWDNPITKRLEPYNLPDQQYCDPEVFGQKFLGLPCHRAWIAVKEDMIRKLKWAIVALLGIGVWILILTTT